jgi:hypothetical protein
MTPAGAYFDAFPERPDRFARAYGEAFLGARTTELGPLTAGVIWQAPH